MTDNDSQQTPAGGLSYDADQDKPTQPADPTYGGGFTAVPFGGPVLARPNDPATRAHVNGLEGRVAALEAWRDSQVSDDRDEPCETEVPTDDTGRARTARALAMLGTAETVIATGSAAEVGGVRLEACDEYGRTATTEALELQRAALRKARAERDMALKGAESAERDAAADEPRLGCATTAQLIAELAARADVSATLGEKWPTYRTVDR